MNRLIEVPVKNLHYSELNPRKIFDEQKIDELAESIRENGILQPVVVRPHPKSPSHPDHPEHDQYEIVCGARRVMAAKWAGLETIPALIRELNDGQMLEIMVIENLQREDIHPMEEAEGFQAMLAQANLHGNIYSVEEISARIGKSQTYVYSRLSLCDLIRENVNLFCQGYFSLSAAMLLARVPRELQREAGFRIAANEFYDSIPLDSITLPDVDNDGFRQATIEDVREYLSQDLMTSLSAAPFDTDDPQLVPAAGSCRECPKCTTNMPDLFPMEKARCSDLVCYRSKLAAHRAWLVDQLASEGHNLVEDMDSIFTGQMFCERLDPKSGYRRVSEFETMYEQDADDCEVVVNSLEDIINRAGGQEHIEHAVSPSGEHVRLIRKEKLAELQRQAGFIDRKTATIQQKKEALAKEAKDQAKREKEEQLSQAFIFRVLDAIVGHIKDSNSFLLNISAHPLALGYLGQTLQSRSALYWLGKYQFFKESDVSRDEVIEKTHSKIELMASFDETTHVPERIYAAVFLVIIKSFLNRPDDENKYKSVGSIGDLMVNDLNIDLGQCLKQARADIRKKGRDKS